jgi:glycosyltransferase involved in cell wall biosynthesis
MTSDPLISIVIPVHKAYYHYLDECLWSIVAQTYTSWEAIIVDDSPQGEDSYTLNDKYGGYPIRLIRHTQNKGLSASRNTGIRASSGDLILPVDADDKLAPTYLARVGGALIEHPHFIAAFCDQYWFGSEERIRQLSSKNVHSLVKHSWIPAQTLFRREVWELVGGYCEEPILRQGAEDWDYWLSVAEAMDLQVLHVPEPLYYYRQHSDSMVRHLLYSYYLVREFLYVRHQKLFDRFGMKRSFLSFGYRRSAKVIWLRGDKRLAVRLGVRSLTLAPGQFAWAGLQALVRVMQQQVTIFKHS